nr:hypothetical protein [Tanacetum cinerariifolium]
MKSSLSFLALFSLMITIDIDARPDSGRWHGSPRPSATGYDNRIGLEGKKAFGSDFEPRPSATGYDNSIGLRQINHRAISKTMDLTHNCINSIEIIMLSDSSDDSKKISNKRPSLTRKSVEGPPRELLRWYRYDTNLSLEDEFPMTDNDTTNNDSSDEDTIQESQSPNCEEKLKVVLPRQRGREKCEMVSDHDVAKANSILGSLTW